MAPVLDTYATAKANLRDNVKTLIAVFGGIAGLMLAGTPFTDYGRLELFSVTWWWATGSLTAAFALIMCGLVILLRTLEPDLVYSSALRTDFETKGLPSGARAEIEALRAEFELRKGELLPDDAQSIELLQKKLDAAWERYDSDAATPADKSDYEDRSAEQSRINNWAAFTRLHFRVRRGTNRALLIGTLALAGVFVFASAVGSASAGDPKPSIVVMGDYVSGIQETSPEVPPPPTLDPVRFKLGGYELNADALDAIQAVRNYLRAHPHEGVVLLSYTDTLGGPVLNARLAARRAAAVRYALERTGGISSSRIFSTALPETDLPTVTPEETASVENRSVHFMIVPIRRP